MSFVILLIRVSSCVSRLSPSYLQGLFVVIPFTILEMKEMTSLFVNCQNNIIITQHRPFLALIGTSLASDYDRFHSSDSTLALNSIYPRGGFSPEWIMKAKITRHRIGVKGVFW